MKYIYKITIGFDGQLVVIKEQVVSETSKVITSSRNTYRKSEMNKMTSHKCMMIDQKAFYTLCESMVNEYIGSLQLHYNKLFLKRIEEYNSKVNLLNSTPVYRTYEEFTNE
jgi:hypothetical protein